MGTVCIRGSKNPVCELCSHSVESVGGTLYCSIKETKTERKASCPSYEYDIFKYKPSDKHSFKKFSKEDFEI